MNITWLGQGGYIVEQAGKRLIIDPYLSDALASLQGLRRLFPPPLIIGELLPDYVFITHDHFDHFDPNTLDPLLHMFPECLLLGPKSVAEHGRRMGIEEYRLIEVFVGEKVSLPSFTLIPTPANHSDPHAVGLILKSDDKLIYLSGDSLYNPDLAPCIYELAAQPLDATFICINGRLGNMNHVEAAELASDLRPAVAVPMHYGLFAENTADPHQFVTACQARGQKAYVFENGETLQI